MRDDVYMLKDLSIPQTLPLNCLKCIVNSFCVQSKLFRKTLLTTQIKNWKVSKCYDIPWDNEESSKSALSFYGDANNYPKKIFCELYI